MLKLIIEKLQGVLSSDDLNDIKTTIQTIISEAVEEKSKDIIAKEKAKIELHAEEYCVKQIAEGIEKEKNILLKEYDCKLDEFENTILKQFDEFIDLEITSKISNDLIKKIAINERYAPIVEGIKSLFEEQYVEIDSEGDKLLKGKEIKIKELEESVTEAIADKMELSEELKSLKKALVISEKTADLTETEREKVKSFCESRTYEEVSSDIDNIVEVVLESKTIEKNVIDESAQDVVGDDEGLTESIKTVPDSIKDEDPKRNIYTIASEYLD